MDSQPFDYILSDLYFPSGHQSNSMIYKSQKRFAATLVQSYIEQAKLEYNPLIKAARLVFAELLGRGEDVFEAIKILPCGHDPKMREAISRGLKKEEELNKYLGFIKDIEENEHYLPQGLFIYKKAQDLQIPCAIVTSEYHHGTKFQPFASSVGHYQDQLNEDGSKKWKQALDYLVENGRT